MTAAEVCSECDGRALVVDADGDLVDCDCASMEALQEALSFAEHILTGWELSMVRYGPSYYVMAKSELEPEPKAIAVGDTAPMVTALLLSFVAGWLFYRHMEVDHDVSN